jgi:hypothetical protein
VHAAVLADQPLEVALGFSYSEKRITVHDCGVRSDCRRRRWFHPPRRAGRSTPCRPSGRPCSRCTWRRRSAWRPAGHRCTRLGGGTVVADMRLISRDCNAMFISSGLSFFHLHQERLDSGVCELPSPTTGVSVLAR